MGRNSCCVKQKLRKGLWCPEEDEKLYNYITRFGVGCWSSVPKLAGTLFIYYYFYYFLHIWNGDYSDWIRWLIHAGLQRCGKSCRLRWINYLRPDLKRGMFSQQEEDLIINLHEALGNRSFFINLLNFIYIWKYEFIFTYPILIIWSRSSTLNALSCWINATLAFEPHNLIMFQWQ